MTFLRLEASRLSWRLVLAGLAVLVTSSTLAQGLDPSICASNYHHPILGSKYASSTCPLPIDEESAIDTGTWAPWKRRPYCVEPLLEAPGPEFCVYTFEPFRGDQAISVVTTPALAASMVDALDDSIISPKLRNHSSNFFPAGKEGPAYAVEDVPGKGKGLVAQRRIRKWDVVLVDYPVILAHLDVFDMVGPDTRQEILEQALHQLPEKQQEELLSLAHSHGGEPIEDIMRTNIFGVELGFEIPHLGLMPIGSRINHDCGPSVFWRYSVRTLAVEVIAMRDIEAGEEITQSYVPLGLSYEDRKEDLKTWGFTCKCSLCTASKGKRTLSDRHRERLQEIYHGLNEGAIGKANLTADMVENLTDKMEALVREEKLEAQLLVYYGVVARAYMRVGELAAARKYVDLCEELWVRYAGEEQDYLAGMHQLRHELSEREKAAGS
ncbi:SET domain-containing protein [Hypoxylon crocopeplum]|nr:SET domain-containing protein [Hypoxylon crocopeplum]